MARQGPETKLVAKMRKAAAEFYGEHLVQVKYHGDQYAKAGVSDLLCVLDGVFVAVEVKTPESYGKSVERALVKGPSTLQRAFVGHVLEAGGCAGFAATVEQYMEILAHAYQRDTMDDFLGKCPGHYTDPTNLNLLDVSRNGA